MWKEEGVGNYQKTDTQAAIVGAANRRGGERLSSVLPFVAVSKQEQTVPLMMGNPRRKIINGYEWDEEIGKGAWGKVRRVRYVATGEECAVKILYKSMLSRKIKNGLQLLYEYVSLFFIDENLLVNSNWSGPLIIGI